MQFTGKWKYVKQEAFKGEIGRINQQHIPGQSKGQGWQVQGILANDGF